MKRGSGSRVLGELKLGLERVARVQDFCGIRPLSGRPHRHRQRGQSLDDPLILLPSWSHIIYSSPGKNECP